MPRPNVKEQLIVAGLNALLEKGFNGVGVQEITEQAGVPKGSFYNHFESKEALGLRVRLRAWRILNPEHLVHRGLEGAAIHGAAAGDVNGVPHHGRTHAVARRGHRGVSLPAVRLHTPVSITRARDRPRRAGSAHARTACAGRHRTPASGTGRTG